MVSEDLKKALPIIIGLGGAVAVIYGLTKVGVETKNIKKFDARPSKTAVRPGDSFSVTIIYMVKAGTYDLYINDRYVDTITENQDLTTEKSRSYVLGAPSEEGDYLYEVKLVSRETGETAKVSFTIRVSASVQEGLGIYIEIE